jgi:hypothetical protein
MCDLVRAAPLLILAAPASNDGLDPRAAAHIPIGVATTLETLLAEGPPALIAGEQPTGGGVPAADTVSTRARSGLPPTGRTDTSPQGDCSGALTFAVTLAGGRRRGRAHPGWDGTPPGGYALRLPASLTPEGQHLLLGPETTEARIRLERKR